MKRIWKKNDTKYFGTGVFWRKAFALLLALCMLSSTCYALPMADEELAVDVTDVGNSSNGKASASSDSNVDMEGSEEYPTQGYADAMFDKIITEVSESSLVEKLFGLPTSAQNAITISIVTEAPTVGHEILTTLEGELPEQYTYQWLVCGEPVDCVEAAYIPTASDFESWIEVRILDENGDTVTSDRVYFSPLPVVYIDTGENATITRENYVDASMLIQGSEIFDKQYEGAIEIKGRGNSSWGYDKKPYKLKLSKKTDLFGFGKSKHYVLLANYLDSSLLRNTMAYRLAAAVGLVATDSTWVDVVMNGEYIGNYQLCEHIRVGAQLLDIENWEDITADAAKKIYKANKSDFSDDGSGLEDYMLEDLSWITNGTVTYEGKSYEVSRYYQLPSSITGGYLFELDDEEDKETTCFKTGRGVLVNVISPEYLKSNSDMLDDAKTLFEDVEDAMTSADGYNSKGQHYSDLIDVDSLIAYWLVMEILSNDDASVRSRYCYQTIGGKLTFGPVWDFDISSGAFRSFMDPYYWCMTGSVYGLDTKQNFWKEIVDDPYFQVKAQEKYWQMRPALEAMICEGGLIDQYAEYLYEAGVSNETRWVTDKEVMGRNFSGTQGDVAIYKSFLQERIAWMDRAFATEKTTNAALYIPISETPYCRSSLLRLYVANGTADTTAHGADYSVAPGDSLELRNGVLTGETRIYINGHFYGSYSAKALYNGITIPAEALDAEVGYKNVISAVTKVGRLTCRNHISVVVAGGSKQNYTLEVGAELQNTCTVHTLTRVSGRGVSDSRYGLQECWYCSGCGQYFADEAGTVPMKTSSVVQPVREDVFSGNYLEKILHLILHSA